MTLGVLLIKTAQNNSLYVDVCAIQHSIKISVLACVFHSRTIQNVVRSRCFIPSQLVQLRVLVGIKRNQCHRDEWRVQPILSAEFLRLGFCLDGCYTKS